MRTLKNILLGTMICLISNVTVQAQKGWMPAGPRNIAGRILAVHVDVKNSQRVYAGSAGGGLWISTNGGDSWSRDTSLKGSPAVSAITQSSNGDIYIGTGEGLNQGGSEPGVVTNNYPYGIIGDGVYKSTDNGQTFTHLSGTETWTDVNAIAYDNANGKLYVATNEGLKVSSNGGSTFTDAVSNGRGVSVKVGSDGTVIYADIKTASNSLVGDVYVSTNGGAFVSVGGSALPKLPVTDMGRISVDIAPSNPNVMYALLSTKLESGTDIVFGGTYVSIDKGKNWRVVFPTGSTQSDPMKKNWGYFCNAMAVNPVDSSKVLVGGQQLYFGAGFNPVDYYQWRDIPLSAIHCICYADSSKAYIGTNVGVSVVNIASSITVAPCNNTLATLQAYTFGVGNDGNIMIGTRDNGMILLTNPSGPSKTGTQLTFNFSDGADCIFSAIKPDALFYTGAYGYCYRQSSINAPAQSPDAWMGGSVINQSTAGKYFYSNIINKKSYNDAEKKYTRWQYSSGGGTIPNNSGLTIPYANSNVSPLAFWESINDENSIDSVTFTVDKTYAPGDTMCILSKRNRYPMWIKYTGIDTLRKEKADVWKVKDVVTSRFFIGGSGYTSAGAGAPVFMTTDAFDFINNISDFVCVFRTKDVTEQVMKMLPSKDGDHLFILTKRRMGNLSFYSIYRVSGFDKYRTPEEMEVSEYLINSKADFSWDNPKRKLKDNVLLENFLYDILDIALDPQDNNTLAFTTNDAGQRINVITDALTAEGGAATVVSKEGIGLPATAPVYCAIVEMSEKSNSNLAYVGTEEGVYKTKNFTDPDPTWELYNTGINAKVPVFKLYQQTNYIPSTQAVFYKPNGDVDYTLPFQGVTNYGTIYAATHGLGIFIDNTYWDDIPEPAPFPIALKGKSVNLHIFPNPAANSITVDFALAATNDVQITISDIAGRTVFTKSLGARMIGNHQEQIDCSVLPEGFYFVTVDAGYQKQTGRIVISK